MNINSENPKNGREFQELSADLLSKYFNCSFNNDIAIPIGNPAKNHKFNCVTDDKKMVAECKCYTWTETGNIPSAKMGSLNQAVFYMSYLPADTKKMIVMKKASHARKNETLAEYYLRTNRHLLEGIMLFEIDSDMKKIAIIKE